MSDSLWPHGLQHARLPCPSLSPRVGSNSCPLMISKPLALCHNLLPLPSVFPSIRVFSSESVLRIRWPKYWSFSISPSNAYSGSISFRIDWFDLLVSLSSIPFHERSIAAQQFSCGWTFPVWGLAIVSVVHVLLYIHSSVTLGNT